MSLSEKEIKKGAEKFFAARHVREVVQELRDFIWDPEKGIVCEHNCYLRINGKLNELFGLDFLDTHYSQKTSKRSEDKHEE